MGSVMADFVSVASMFIGLATLTVLVRNARDCQCNQCCEYWF